MTIDLISTNGHSDGVVFSLKQKNYEIIWQGESEILLPNGSKLKFKKTKGKGIPLSKLKNKKLKITNRQDKQSLKLDSKRPSKSLKNLYQESNIPPWIRKDLPLIFIDQDLAFVPHLGISIKMKSEDSEKSLEIELIH